MCFMYSDKFVCDVRDMLNAKENCERKLETCLPNSYSNNTK